MAEPEDADRQGPQGESQEAEDVGEPHIATSLDCSSHSSPLKKREEEERGNVDSVADRAEIEEWLGEISVRDSPEDENCKEPCCTDIDASPSLKAVKKKDIDECIYHLKWIMWHERKAPIVTQNENGPCPLIAISNILLLRGKIILPTVMEIITAKQLMEYIGDMILQNVPKDLTLPHQLNYEQNMHDAIAVLPRLHTGLDVNVKFTGVKDFEYTPECIIFDLLNIPLYHGWLVDPQCHETVIALGSLGYNQVVEKIILNKCSSKIDLVTEALIAEQFLERTASQLTYHGLCELNTAMGQDELAVLFRNNHFSTIFKKKVCGPVDEASSDLLGMSQELNELFQLVTDQGFLHEPRVVWETLSNIEGDGMFVDGHFVTVPPKAAGPCRALPLDVSEDQQINHDFLLALSLQEEQKAQYENEQAWEEFKQTQEITCNEELAHHLHEDERQRAQSPVPVAAVSHGHTRPYAHAQPASGDRNKKESCTIL
ncbi:Ubiquitin carboxyl-terminal hydrolase MINDY-1 [Cryptotermes secundus]|uniref:Ubiquitin carboxyl-terminal hydrolase n=1 Tax=Cryptotermes secundus TaxID=105785 RepID=A0A2J7QIJ1_9NEOP|nr:ubiquitin carboxyl-terminal hydrolase MINDY-2 isoform X1 [Cryptotermes secundus]XP_023712839.1 ubiquitin carboxyl-terminal hydrolase MINDY-2 isoform X1 [Cryptotermes secundus]XP_023712840.1 ubiquitin carboxyl-terminal hydrolase MINDY-2 isoform X1 [Cryptotermes secundus]XP_023712841.1 ubiquitin carboxyl-terminal hydrolase MINDY-2 isoform X1 [Cryptotermes secundus]XP_033608527.1 ubiquitin carboxyl-terminal hydrolase MINDY-2 isoform X1 [Cryptotermes secundus]XP_033608528.1 ubiquitin carboxyl-t